MAVPSRVTRQRLGADGRARAHVAVAGADDEALLHARAELVGQDRVVGEAQQHRLRLRWPGRQ